MAILERLFGELGGVDLVIISAATGHNNAAMHGDLDVATVTANVLGFMAAFGSWRGTADTLSSVRKSSRAVSTRPC